MNIRKIEVVLLLIATLIVFMCVVAVYVSHFSVEKKLENCRYYAKGLTTGFNGKLERTNDTVVLIQAAKSDIYSLLSLGEKSVQERHKSNNFLSSENKVYKAAYEGCVASL